MVDIVVMRGNRNRGVFVGRRGFENRRDSRPRVANANWRCSFTSQRRRQRNVPIKQSPARGNREGIGVRPDYNQSLARVEPALNRPMSKGSVRTSKFVHRHARTSHAIAAPYCCSPSRSITRQLCERRVIGKDGLDKDIEAPAARKPHVDKRASFAVDECTRPALGEDGASVQGNIGFDASPRKIAEHVRVRDEQLRADRTRAAARRSDRRECERRIDRRTFEHARSHVVLKAGQVPVSRHDCCRLVASSPETSSPDNRLPSASGRRSPRRW